MRNPFRSEEAAFRFLWLTIAYFALIAIASLINTWAGLAVFLLMTGALVTWWLMCRGTPRSGCRRSPPPHPADEKRVLVIANETVAGPELLAELKQQAPGGKTEVLVVTPALNTPLKHWVSDEDGARAAAAERLEASLEAMRAAGTRRPRRGRRPRPAPGDRRRDPHLLARRHHHLDPPGGPLELARAGVVEGARERFDLPVTHVVVDLDAAAPRRAGRDFRAGPGTSVPVLAVEMSRS